jgi:hypothetical protein
LEGKNFYVLNEKSNNMLTAKSMLNSFRLKFRKLPEYKIRTTPTYHSTFSFDTTVVI